MNDDPNHPSDVPDPEVDASNDDAQPDNQGEYYEPAPKFARTLDYMEGDKGHEVTLRLVTMLEQFSPTIQGLLNAKIANQQAAPKVDFLKWITLLIALLIGGLVAYFFGYNRSQP